MIQTTKTQVTRLSFDRCECTRILSDTFRALCDKHYTCMCMTTVAFVGHDSLAAAGQNCCMQPVGKYGTIICVASTTLEPSDTGRKCL